MAVVSDPIADFLTRIRNASRAQHRYVDVNWSKLKQDMAEILKAFGFIESYIVQKEPNQRGTMRMFLKYSDHREPVILGLKRLSTPGSRKFVGSTEIPTTYGGMGLTILSTSQGLMSGSEAKKRNIGGELLCMVW